MINSTDLEYFKEVARHLNMTRASERLGVSQPALSHSLKRLEESLGVVLFVRGKKGVQLTKAGEKLELRTQEILRGFENLRAEILLEEKEVSGVFKLGCHPSVALYTLDLFAPDLLKENPKLEIKLSHGLSRHIAEDVISDRIDFGLVINPPQHPDLIIKELCKDEVTLWMTSELKNPDVIIYDPELLQVKTILKNMEKKKIFFRRKIESSNLEVIAGLIDSGAGVGILPSRVAQRMASGKIKRFSTQAPSFFDRLCLVYKPQAQRNFAAQAIIKKILSTEF